MVVYSEVYVVIVMMNNRGTLGRIWAIFIRDARYFQFHIFDEF